MGWRDLITKEEKTVVLPWVGGRSLHFENQIRKLVGEVPSELGWYEFSLTGSRASVVTSAEPESCHITESEVGYLIGNRFVPDTISSSDIEQSWPRGFEQVCLIEEGLDRFTRIEVGRWHEGGRLLFKGLAFPLGPEEEVLSAFLDQKTSTDGIKDVVPSLQMAFELESFEREKIVTRRRALLQLRKDKEVQAASKQRRKELSESLGTGQSRRKLAAIDFHSAAAAALAIGGADLLDVRNGRETEKIIRYRLHGRRFECICDMQLRIIDAGVCLTDETTGEKGDTFFTLESLPAVIGQAEREGVLVIYRHV